MTARPPVPRRVLGAQARRIVREDAEALLDYQHRDGYWEARVDSDASVTAQYLLAARYLDRLDPVVEAPMLEYLRHTQLRDGGWSAYPGGPASLDVSLSCYAALRFGGLPAEHPALARARRIIIAQGGLEGVGFVPRVPLVFWGQVPPTCLTYLSPKILFIPPSVHPNLRDLGILTPPVLAVELLLKRQAVRAPQPGCGLAELRTGGEFPMLAMSLTGTMLSAVSRWVDAALPARNLDRRAADWLAEQQNADGLWTGFAHFTSRCMMALQAIDDGRYRSAIDSGLAGLARLQVSEAGMRWQQLGRSPVLDTAIAILSLTAAGVPAGHPRLHAAYDWLIGAQPRRDGDWQWNAPRVAPGGWSYHPHNDRNPDTVTTLHVLEALLLAPPDVSGRERAIGRGLRWMLAMQNARGSWGMFTRESPRHLRMIREFEQNCVTETGTPDITARAVRILARLQAVPGLDGPHLRRAIARGCTFLATTQGPDGAWPGRWAVNYTHGTAQGLAALTATRNMTGAKRARDFLRSAQQPNGGWGESPESYAAGQFLPTSGTVTHTALALTALLSAGRPEDPAIAAGVRFLLDRRPSRGALWADDTFCQVLVPGHMYFQNALIAPCYGLMAVSRYQQLADDRPEMLA